jgi:hypothetical protein
MRVRTGSGWPARRGPVTPCLMATSDLVLREGDRVRASGRVITEGDTAWFDPPLPVPLVWRGPGREPTPRAGRFAVPVVGVDPASLDYRRATSNVVDGWATRTGTWRQDRLLVERQEPRESARESAPRWSRPPCRDKSAVTVCMCGEAARQLEEAGQRLRAQMPAWLIFGTGQSVSEDGQAVLTAELTRVLPTFAQWADAVTEGLLSFTPWLVPQRTAMPGRVPRRPGPAVWPGV